jgi:hypothetical protein
MASEMIHVKGRYLTDLTIKDPQNSQKKYSFPDYLRGSFKHSEPMRLEAGKWTFVYAARDADLANNFMAGLRKSSGRMGVLIEEPDWLELEGNRADDYLNGFRQIKNTTQIVLVLLFNDKEKHKLKNCIDNKVGVPSQFVLGRTADRATKALAVAGNILKQMNAKVRKDLYRMDFSGIDGTMVVGVSAVNHQKGMIFALVSTYSATLS